MHEESDGTEPAGYDTPDDAAAHAAGDVEREDAAGDVEAHIWGNKPPIVDDPGQG
jgi:hypothetical protein